MKTVRSTWSPTGGWSGDEPLDAADWVLYFAAPEAPAAETLRALKEQYPSARILGCTTGGEIAGADVADGSVSVVAVQLRAATVRGASVDTQPSATSFDVGLRLGEALTGDGLRAVFVLSDGTRVNGTELVLGLRRVLGDDVSISGGLAGDGARFGATRVGLDEEPAAGRVAAIALYGESLLVGHGTAGGWVPFGPERVVTRSNGNVLLELDHRPALDLYKSYLGEEAERLPASALLYPLIVRRETSAEPIVRTIVGVDEATRAMTFAGDVPEGAIVQLMRASLDELVDGAAAAATQARRAGPEDGLAVLVSCIGRKLLMGQRTADEVEAVADVLGAAFEIVGFYSYGEISPAAGGFSDLHNQTMTITTFSERAA
jgi:hypothetical protein